MLQLDKLYTNSNSKSKSIAFIFFSLMFKLLLQFQIYNGSYVGLGDRKSTKYVCSLHFWEDPTWKERDRSNLFEQGAFRVYKI